MSEPPVRAYALEFTPAALRDVQAFDPNVRRKVFADLEKLKQNPRPHGIEKLAARKSSIAYTSDRARSIAPFIRFGTRA